MRQIDAEDIIQINAAICETFDEPSSVISEDRLYSAISVFNSYFNSDNEVASALFRSLILNHPFADGNKRTAIVVLYYMHPPNKAPEDIENVAISIAKGELKYVEDICKLLYET